MTPLEWMLIGMGFTGALVLALFAQAAARRFGLVPSLASHFSPKGGCTEAIVREIRHAHKEILVLAYSFSCPAIAAALLAAQARGVRVKIVLDRANEKETYSELGVLEEQGLHVLVDSHHAIAHNKVMIIDRKTLITGSFNFTRQAELENAENLLIIKGCRQLIADYANNFQAHFDHSQAPGKNASLTPTTSSHGRFHQHAA